MAELGSAYVNIIPKAPGIERNLKQLLNDNMPDTSKQGQKLGNGLVSGIKKVVAGAAIGKFVADAFSAGGDLQQSFGGLDTIYGDAAEAAKKYAKQAAKAGISANSYAEQAVSSGAALKQAFGGDTQKAMDAANTAIMDMTDNAAKMGTPIESIQMAYQGFAKQNYTMLDNLKLGYGGTKTEMERLLADAQKLTGVKYDIGNLGDVYDAIHAIQGELGLTGVAAQEASTTLTGSFGAVKASWENTMAALVTGEGLNEAMANLSTSVGGLTGNVLTALENIVPQIPTLVGGIVSAIIDHAPDIASSAVSLLAELGGGLISNLPVIFERIPEIFSGISEKLMEQDWESPGAELIAAIGAGISGAIGLLFDAVDAAVQAVVNALDGWLGQAAAKLASLFAMAADGAATAQGSMGVSGGNNVTIPRSKSVGGYATGLNYVPYDEFPALLHQGEMVVPRRLASQMRAAGISKDSQSLPLGVVGAAEPTQVNVVVEFRGSLAQLARILQPEIKVVTHNNGPQMSKA